MGKNSTLIAGGLSGSVIGGLVGGSIASKALTKGKKRRLQELTDKLIKSLQRQPKAYSLYVYLKQKLKDIAVMDKENPNYKNTKKLTLTLTSKLLESLPQKDKDLYIEIQNLTNSIYNIEKTSFAASTVIGGIVGLVIGEKLNKNK